MDDMPVFTNELYAAFVLSSRAHAHILSIDESEALQVEGVERFFCARDLPGKLFFFPFLWTVILRSLFVDCKCAFFLLHSLLAYSVIAFGRLWPEK